MDQPALAGMVSEIAKAPYLDTVVISLDRADRAGYERALAYFKALGHRTVLLWNDAPALAHIVAAIESNVIQLAPRGKGRAVWMALGYALAESRAGCLALHDADVLDYDRSLLANLVSPIVHPQLNFEFSKAYYARFTDRLHGRVTRLLMRPLLQALGDVVGRNPFLSYMSAFRYPLAGELAFAIDLGRWARIPGDWGLEVGLLFETLRHRSPRRVCQVDVADRFEHKHQELSPTDPSQGLHRMAVDIIKHLLRTLSAAGVVLPEGSFKSMRVAYQRYAEDAVADSYAVSVFNGLAYDRHAEEEVIETFSLALAEGCQQFQDDPLGTPALPNWARVVSALPDIGNRLLKAVKSLDGIIDHHSS
jgi:glucosyl-3-phosphoglycerate synthase